MQCQFGGNIIAANDSTIWQEQNLDFKDTLLSEEDIFSGLTPEGKENLCSNCFETKLWPPARFNISFKESLITATFAFVCRMFVIHKKIAQVPSAFVSCFANTINTSPSVLMLSSYKKKINIWCSAPTKEKYKYLMLSSYKKKIIFDEGHRFAIGLVSYFPEHNKKRFANLQLT